MPKELTAKKWREERDKKYTWIQPQDKYQKWLAKQRNKQQLQKQSVPAALIPVKNATVSVDLDESPSTETNHQNIAQIDYILIETLPIEYPVAVAVLAPLADTVLKANAVSNKPDLVSFNF
jgi:hypothetical protein